MTALDFYHELLAQGFSLLVNGDKLRLSPVSQLTDQQRANVISYKSELIALLAKNDHLITTDSPTNRYQSLIKCQQCEHLALNGHCLVKSHFKPMPDALRDCEQFIQISGKRLIIENMPYTQIELNDSLAKLEKLLLHHLVDCKDCSFMDSKYCVDIFAIGNSYEDMLLVLDDADSKKGALINLVIKARIYGSRVLI